jgi:acetyl esterase/lipase
MMAAGRTGEPQPSPAAMRATMSKLAQAVDAVDVSIRASEDREIPGPAGGIPLRIYTPATTAAATLPALIYFHGGAGVFCSIETHDGLCRMLANESSCRVISVAYRLAPEHKFPAAIDDARAATQWIFAHCEGLGIDPKLVAVGGDSAGATLATVVCQQAKEMTGPDIALQVLLCPVTDLRSNSTSRRAFSEGYFFDMAMLDWALGHYLPANADLTDPRLSPLRAADLSGLPPAHIHTAEFDPFRDDGKAYADALHRAGIPVAYTSHQGMIHHFYCMAGAIPSARVAVKEIGNSIKSALFCGPGSRGSPSKSQRQEATVQPSTSVPATPTARQIAMD